MFTINQGFDLNSPQFNFKRDYFASVADLKAAPETSFPDHFITNVAGVLYQLTKSNSVDTTTGKWRKVQLGSDVDLSNYAQKSELNKYNQALKSISFNNGKGITGTNINNTIVNLGSINDATDSSDGLMSATDKAKLDGIAANANNYTLPTATTAALGGIKTNYTTNGKNYKVQVDDSGNAYVNVPWTDTKTDISKCIKVDERKNIWNYYAANVDVLFGGDRDLNGKLFAGVSFRALFDSNNHGSDVAHFGAAYASDDSTNSEGFLLLSTNYSQDKLQLTSTGITKHGGSANKLFATDGSIFDASTLATTAALNSALANYVKSTTLTTELTKYANLNFNNTFKGVITAQGFKLPNGNSGNLLAADGSLMNLAKLVRRSYSATDDTNFSIDWIRQFSGYTTSDSFVNNTTGFGIVRELRGGKSEVLIDSTGAINIASDNIKIYNKSGIDTTNALTFDGSNFSIKSDNGTSAQYYAADGSIQTLTAISTEKLNEIFV